MARSYLNFMRSCVRSSRRWLTLLTAAVLLCSAHAQERTPLTPPGGVASAETATPANVRRGRLAGHTSPAALEGLEVTLERGTGEAFPKISAKRSDDLDLQLLTWERVARVPLEEDGSFAATLPEGERYLRFVARGRFAFGLREIVVDASSDPGAETFPLELHLGGELTAQLVLDDEASETERSALVGRRIFARARWWHFPLGADWPEQVRGSAAVLRGATVNEELRLVFSHVPVEDLELDARYLGGTDADKGPVGVGVSELAPFCVPLGLRVRPAAGRATEVRVPLERGVDLRALVTDEDGTPLAGATFDTSAAEGSASLGESTRTRTDDRGRVLVQALARAPESVTVYAQPFLPTVVSGAPLERVAEGGELHVVMRSGGSLRVRVTTPDGRPAQGFVVTVIDPKGGHYRERHVLTESDGLASIDLVRGDSIAVVCAGNLKRDEDEAVDRAYDGAAPIRFQRPSGGPVDAPSSVLWMGEVRDVTPNGQTLEVVLQPAAPIRGVVRGADPALGAVTVVAARVGPQSDRYGLTSGRVARLPADPGTREFSLVLPPGRFHVAAIQGRSGGQILDMATLRATPNVTIEVSTETEVPSLELDFGVAAPMTGSVRDADGEPAAGVTVSIMRTVDGRSDATTTAVTDVDGAFRTASLLGGEYNVQAWPGYGAERASAYGHPFDPKSAAPVALVFESLGWVQIASSDATRKVRVGYRGPMAYWNDVPASSDGRTRFGPLKEGTYCFALETVHADGSVTMDGQLVRVQPGVTTAVQLGIEREGARGGPSVVEGRVTSGGRPQAGLRIYLEHEAFDVAWTTTNRDGQFTLIAPFAGAAALHIDDRDFREIARRSLTLTAASTTPYDVELPTGAIELARHEVAGISGFLHLFALEPGAESGEGRPLRSSRMVRFPYVEDGRYEVRRVLPGGAVAARALVEVSGGTVVRGVELEPVEGSGR
ncbi:MAG: carboxypeptidase-like regulatory domain-containing protein [Planctomycetota bacterium]